MSETIKLFIVEGEDRDYRFIVNLTQLFFNAKQQFKTIHLPAKQNIFMLYQQLKEDEFETDLVELLRERVEGAQKILEGIRRQDISEVYLFFDADLQEDNLDDKHHKDVLCILREMLEVFDNETEQGRLYISYPMVEALYDYQEGTCEAYSDCYCPVSTLKNYKRNAGENNPNASRHLNIEMWKIILKDYIQRIECLFGGEIEYEDYRNRISPLTIFLEQLRLIQELDSLFVLSAFPEFLFDYFRKSFWVSNGFSGKSRYKRCAKRNTMLVPQNPK